VFRLKYNDKKKMNRHAIRLSRGSDLVSKLHQLDREWKTLTRSDTPLVHTTENAMAILKKTAPQITGWSLRVATTDVNEPLVQYYPSSGVLEMQDAVFGLFREEDMVVVAVHELLGHHVQEQRIRKENPDYFMVSRTDMQEGCAMQCEAEHLVGFYERTRIEWEMFRILRALEDLGQLNHWDMYPHAHRMPREYVQSYVRKFPGKAQHYIFASTDSYCGCGSDI
tara:strand:+ start:170 stop:841 length:672 start_codon:yes stop_codon:yes gene_type:complete